MTASSADSHRPRNLGRTLTLRFSALLFLFLALSGGTYVAVSSAVSAKEYDSVVANLAGRQRMLTQKYAHEIIQVLVALAVSDWELAVEMKEATSKTSEHYDTTLAAFLEGGEVYVGREERTRIPPIRDADVVEQLKRTKSEWDELHRIALQAIRSDSLSLVSNEYVRNIQTQTSKVVAEMEFAVTLMQKQSEVRLHRVETHMICACILSVMLFVGTVVFVRTRIVVPLDKSTTALETEITERKRAEEQLRKLSRAVEQSPAVVVITDTQGAIEYVNPKFVEVTGYTADEAIGQNPRILKSGETPPEEYKRLWATISSGTEWRGEFHNKKKNGELYWELASISPIRNSEGTITHYLAVKEDITERKRVEEERRRQNTVLDAINRVFRETLACETEEELGKTCLAVAENLTDSKFGFLGEVNSAGLMDTIAISNPGWDVCEMAASTAKRFTMGMPIRGIDRSTIRDGKSRIVNADEMANHPDRVGTPEGHPEVTAFLGVPLKHEGKTIGMIGLGNKESGYDATDQEAVENLAVAIVEALRRKRAEEELRLSEARTHAIVDHAADGIITIDERGIIESFNKAAENIFGYAADEVIDKDISVLMPSPYSEEQDGYLERYLDSGVKKFVGMRHEVLGWRKDGSTFPLDLHVSEIQHNGCRVFTGIVRDLTNRKQLEQERINRLQLEQERNHLRDAVRAHEKILGVVGHELRTPLASMRAMAEFLLNEEARGTAEADTFLRSIHDEVIRMGGMVNDLLEVARMNSGAERWNWSEVRVAQVCDDAIETVSSLMDRDKVALAVNVDPPDLRMTGDPEAIRRLLVNLLTNAHKHTTQGSIRVQASEMCRDNHCWVKLQVSDTGEGIPPEVAGRLGMPFALNSGVVGESHVKGSGLGLAICRGIVAAHGGAISVETALGQGTSFTILLRADLPEPALGQEPTEITCEVQQ